MTISVRSPYKRTLPHFLPQNSCCQDRHNQIVIICFGSLNRSALLRFSHGLPFSKAGTNQKVNIPIESPNKLVPLRFFGQSSCFQVKNSHALHLKIHRIIDGIAKAKLKVRASTPSRSTPRRVIGAISRRADSSIYSISIILLTATTV